MNNFKFIFMVAALSTSFTVTHQQCEHCALSVWTEWTGCSASCGGGHKSRFRSLCCDRHWSSNGQCSGECGTGRDDLNYTQTCNEICNNGGLFSGGKCHCINPQLVGRCCQYTTECGHPGPVANGRVLGDSFYYGDSVTYECNDNFKLTDGDRKRTCGRENPSDVVGFWSGRQPRCAFAGTCLSQPCRNGGTCVNDVERYDCACKRGWGGNHCQLDVLPPSMNNCPDDRQHFTERLMKMVQWKVPEFYDEMGNDVTVTSNFPSNSADFWWGDNTVKYTGRKENNALTTTCAFNEVIDPHPCEELPAPDNGAVACNGWNSRFSRVCAYFCPEDLTFGPENDIKQLLVCGADGTWSPVIPQANCNQQRIRVKDVNHFAGSCEDAVPVIGQNYISMLTSQRSPFYPLCAEFSHECEPDHVNVTCYSDQ